MKKYIVLTACLALFLTLQTPSEARPDKGPHGQKPPAHHNMKKPQHNMHRPPRNHVPPMHINYSYTDPCRIHHRYDCYNCYHRPHHRGHFGSGFGFTIFL